MDASSGWQTSSTIGTTTTNGQHGVIPVEEKHPADDGAAKESGCRKNHDNHQVRTEYLSPR